MQVEIDAARRARRTLAVVLVAAASLLAAASPALGQAVPGKTYLYVHTGGGGVSFTVSADGRSIPTITLFPYTYAAAPGCQRTIAIRLNFATPVPIAGERFSWTASTGLLSLAGTFLPDGTAEGTLRDVGCPQLVWPDGDGDLLTDRNDNCPAAANANQADGDGDGAGDACDATSLPDRKGPAVRVVRAAARLDRRGLVAIRLACPGDEQSCRGTLTIEAARQVAARRSVGLPAAFPVLGKARFRLAGGRSLDVAVRLSARGRDLVRDLGRLRARATVKARDAAGNAKTTMRLITIRPLQA